MNENYSIVCSVPIILNLGKAMENVGRGTGFPCHQSRMCILSLSSGAGADLSGFMGGEEPSPHAYPETGGEDHRIAGIRRRILRAVNTLRKKFGELSAVIGEGPAAALLRGKAEELAHDPVVVMMAGVMVDGEKAKEQGMPGLMDVPTQTHPVIAELEEKLSRILWKSYDGVFETAPVDRWEFEIVPPGAAKGSSLMKDAAVVLPAPPTDTSVN